MNTAFLVMALALIWAAITGSFTGLNLLFGGLVGGLAVLLMRHSFARPMALRRLKRIISLLVLFLYELVVSALKVAMIVIRPDLNKVVQPAIIAYPLTVKSEAEITLLANMITLTPGTLSIDVSADKSVLYIHALTLEDRDAAISSIANGFERKVGEVFE